jgi:hypothetical protein
MVCGKITPSVPVFGKVIDMADVPINFLLKLIDFRSGIVSLRGSNLMCILLLAKALLEALYSCVTGHDSLTQGVSHSLLIVEPLLSAIKLTLDMIDMPISLIEVTPKLVILVIETAEPIRKLVNPLL